MVNFSHPGAVQAVVSEMLSHILTCLPLIAAVHEGESGRGAPSALTIGSLKNHAAGGESIDVGRVADFVAVTSQGAGLEVIGDDEEDVFDFCFGGKEAKCRDKDGNEKASHSSSHTGKRMLSRSLKRTG